MGKFVINLVVFVVPGIHCGHRCGPPGHIVVPGNHYLCSWQLITVPAPADILCNGWLHVFTKKLWRMTVFQKSWKNMEIDHVDSSALFFKCVII